MNKPCCNSETALKAEKPEGLRGHWENTHISSYDYLPYFGLHIDSSRLMIYLLKDSYNISSENRGFTVPK